MQLRVPRVFGLALALLCAGVFVFSVPDVFAQSDVTAEVAETAGLGNADLMDSIGRIISVFLGLLGVLFLILFIYAGVLWMTAGGDDKKVEKAKRVLINATIGLVIILMAYGITTFVFNLLSDATGSGGSGSGNNGSVSVERLSGSLGSGAIRDHYPRRNDTDVARNARIIITFKDEMDASTLTVDTVKIYPSSDGEAGALTDVAIAATEDGKTFSFDPGSLLGSSTENVQYTVALGTAIEDAEGGSIFTGKYSGGYEWSFETGTIIDVTAPSVEVVTPVSAGTYDRNIAVQITFDEPVDPTAATGERASGSGFDHITTAGTDGSPTAGAYEISNAYHTVTFIPTDACGTNSCGETMYCLPGSQTMNVTVQAASVGTEAPQASFPYDGIVDMAGNALDGNGDGAAGDDYAWSFSTTASSNLTGPAIMGVSPNILEENVALDEDILVLFDGILQSSSVSSDAIVLTNAEMSSGESHEQWYGFDVDFLTAAGEAVTSSAELPAQTAVNISHGTFLESVDGLSYLYGVDVGDGVRNEYQNCYVPAEGPDGAGGACAVTDAEPYCCNGTPSANVCTLF